MSAPRKLPSGNWRVQWIDARGKRQSATFKTEGAAKSSLHRVQVEADDIRSGRARPRSEQTVREASADWLATRPPVRRIDNASHLEQHILPFMGDRLLPEVTPDLVERFLRHLESKPSGRGTNAANEPIKPGTINNVIITLRKMMNDLDYPLRVRFKVPTGDYDWLKSPGEVARFLAATDGWFRMACELAVYAGLRKGEVAGLVWGAIDFDRESIRVDRSYDGPTKSKHARWVPLAPELARSLKRWRLAHGASHVVTVDGAPIVGSKDFAKRARGACRRAGVDSIPFKALRATYASHLAERVSLPIVGAVLGHADPKTTARYAHIDTASLARDPRLHLSFERPAATVVPLDPDLRAHDMHTTRERKGGHGRKGKNLSTIP